MLLKLSREKENKNKQDTHFHNNLSDCTRKNNLLICSTLVHVSLDWQYKARLDQFLHTHTRMINKLIVILTNNKNHS